MKLSKDGALFIANFEGFRADAYKVPGAGEKYWTIGYGHYGPDVRPGRRISRAAALELLRRDAHSAANAVRQGVRVAVNQCEFDALVSLTFNIGVGAFGSSTVLRELNKGHRFRAGAAFLMWTKAGGRTLLGLSRRRRAERRLFRGKTRKKCGKRIRV